MMMKIKKICNRVGCLLLIVTLVSCNFDHASKLVFYERGITEAFTTGQWKITAFKKDGIEQKRIYESYLFIFTADEIRVTIGASKFYGHWHVESSDGEDDAPDNDIDFVMSAHANPALSDLTASWQIAESTMSKLVLNKVSRSGKTIDLLVFEKI